MSKFEIELNKTQACANDLQLLHNAMMTCHTTLDKVIQVLSTSSSEYSIIVKELEKNKDDINSGAKNTKNLEESLKEIIVLYRAVDIRITSASSLGDNGLNKGESTNEGQWENKYIRKFLEWVSHEYKKPGKNPVVKNLADGWNSLISNSFIGKKLINFFTSDAERESGFFEIIADPVSKLLAFEYDEENDFYITNETYGIQRHGGFSDLYDDLGGFLGMDLDTQVVEFEADGKFYRLQLWKGTYGFGNAYGSEIGLYENSSNESGWYECAAGSDEVVTRQTLIDTKTGEEMTNDTRDYADNGDHFWNLMIRTDSGHDKEDLRQVSYIQFPSDECRDNFLSTVNDDRDSGLEVELQEDGSVKITY